MSKNPTDDADFLTQDDEFDAEETEEDNAEPTGVDLDGLEETADAAEADAE